MFINNANYLNFIFLSAARFRNKRNRIYCVVASICVFRFVYTLPLRRNSEVKKMSTDSESNSFANLSRISDEHIMEEDEEDVEEIDVRWRFDRAIRMPFLKVK